MIARLAAFILLALPAFADPAPEATKAFGAPTAQRLLRVQSTTDIDLIAPVLNAFAGLHPNLRIDYQRPSTPGQDLKAHAQCYCITRSIAFVRATAYHDNPDDPVATATGCFMIRMRLSCWWPGTISP